MAGELAYAWLRQARSDLVAAGRCHDPADGRTACQAVAKCQQVVEKTVKGLVAAMNEVGAFAVNTGYSHDVERLVSALLLLPRRPANRDVQAHLAGLIYDHRRGEIRALSSLAPERPQAGQLALRNTEYPYQNADGSWRAPADPDGFDNSDVRRFRQLAQRLLEGGSQIVASVYR